MSMKIHGLINYIKRKGNDIMKKRILELLAVVIMLTGICFWNGNIGEVKASVGDITNGDGFIAVEYHDLTQYRTGDTNIAPDAPDAYSNYIFAGWYRDAACKGVYGNVTADTTLAYAKFVPSGVLSVKAQLKADANKDANTNMRLVSSVDGLLYEEVGFDVYYNGAAEPVKIRSTKVYQRIVANTSSGVEYNYSPKVVDVESEYFVTATLVNINKDNFGNGFYVKPYWETMDGTVVYGVNKYVTVNNGLDAKNINLTIKADAAFTEPLTVTVGGAEYPATLALYDKESCYDGTYNYVNVTVDNRDNVLKSLNTITVTDGTTTGDSEYRNLMTKYNGTTASIDTSWYDADKDKYVLATSADLYGFAQKTNSANDVFTGKNIYLCADIDANVGTAKETKTVAGDGTITYSYSWDKGTNGTQYPWTRIGYGGRQFTGTFDGQMHTISGIYLSVTSGNYYGLFGCTSVGSTIKNFKLVNSHIENTVASGNAWTGSVAGCVYGTCENIKSEANVVSVASNTGGIVGVVYTGGIGQTKINNCWFAGNMSLGTGSAATGHGGILGAARHAAGHKVSITNCLNSGKITGGYAQTGGICGLWGTGDVQSLTISDCINATQVQATGTQVGEIIGRIGLANAELELKNVYAVQEDEEDTLSYFGAKLGTVTLTTPNSGMVTLSDIKGYSLWYNAQPILHLDFEEYWCLADDSTPQLRKLAETEDILVTLEGKGTEENPWIITEESELIAFSDMSKDHDFSGKYVSIGTEDEAGTLTITLNEGDTVDEVKANAVAEGTNWTPIGSNAKKFAGIFNGNGNAISGLYLSTEEAYQGLFGYVEDATIKNFSLQNSYLEYTGNSNAYLGGIVGYGSGIFKSLKCEANIFSSGSRHGGIVAGLNGTSAISDCWYDGTMELTGGYGGGIVGMVDTATVDMDNCLYTGAITGDATTTGARYSGLCGNLQGNSTLTVEECLSIGTLTSTKSSNWMGPIVGYIDGTVSGFAKLIVNNTYSNASAQYAIRYRQYGSVTCDGTEVSGGNVASNIYTNTISTDDIQGYGAWYNNSSVLNLDFEKYWCLADGTTPQLRSFTDESDMLPMLEGKGTEANPWLIADAEDLSDLAVIAKDVNFADKYVSIGTEEEAGTLTITVNKGATVDEVKVNAVADGGTGNWTPIGSESLPFAGNFNGNGNTISGLYYKGTGTNIGLFGYTANSSTISNLELSNTCYFESENSNTTARIGSVVGCVQGTLDTIKSEATVVSVGHENGGIAGTIRYSGAYSASVRQVKFTNVWFAGTLSLSSNNARFSGGMVGKIYAPNREIAIEHCLVSGTITSPKLDSNSQLGGIVGQANDYRLLTVSDSLVASVTQSVNRDTGAIFGAVDETVGYSLIDVYGVDGEATNGVIYAHGVTGEIKQGTVNTNSVNYGVLDIEDAKGTDAWYNNTLTLDFDNYWVLVEDGTPELKSFSTNGVDIWSGKGTQASPWIISDKDELELLPTLAQTYNFSGKYIQLGSDEQAGELTIAVNEGTIDEIKEKKPENWVPIGKNTNANRFEGTFNGNGNTISGLYYKGEGTYIGLFGTTGTNAEVKNLKITNSYFESSATDNVLIGSVAGIGYGTFKDIKSNAEVVCHGAYGGGLVGGLWTLASSATFDDCWFDGTLRVEGANATKCGGILGGTRQPVEMTNCLNSGNIYVSTDVVTRRVGGLCGFTQADLDITNCLNVKSITIVSGPVSAILGCAYTGTTTTLTNVYAIVGDGADQAYNANGYCGDIQSGAEVIVENDSWAMLTHEQLSGENAETYAPGLFETDTHWVTGDLYPVLNMAGEVYTSIPAMSVSNESNTSTKLTGDGNFVTTVTGTTKENYDDYLTSVVAAQFVKVADNTIDNSVYSSTYTRDGLVLCVTHFAKQNQTSISYYEGAVSDHLVYNADDVAANPENAKTTLSMMELFGYGNSFVIQLKNGHFLISDGGMEQEIEYLLDYLEANTPEGEIPVVEGWFITHAHEDHCGAINAFYDREDLVSRVHVEGVYYSSPNDENVLKNAGGGESKDYVLTRVVRGVLRNSKGEPTALYRPQTGQRYYFNDTTIDILLAQEQLSVDLSEANVAYRSNLNSSSTICLFTSENQTCLLSADLEEKGFDWLFGNYNDTFFTTLDFFTLNHHGFNTSDTIATNITAKTVLLTVRDGYDDRCAENIQKLINKAEESMMWGEGTVVFTFPHTAGNNSYQRLAPNTWKYHEGVDRPVQENIDGTLE